MADSDTTADWEAWKSDLQQLADERGIYIHASAYRSNFDLGHSPEDVLEEADDDED